CWAVAEKSTPRIGAVGLVAKSLRDHLLNEKYPDAVFADGQLLPSGAKAPTTPDVLKQALKEMGQQKVELAVLLLQGKEHDPISEHGIEKEDPSLKEARACAEYAAGWHKQDPALAPLSIVLWVTGRSDPPSVPERSGNTLLITLGQKGRFIGVVGVFKDPAGDGYQFKYQLVSVGEQYETPKGDEESHPVTVLMGKYANDVKNEHRLAKYHRSMHKMHLQFPETRYVGSGMCFDCHQDAYAIWEKSHHAHAYETLEKAAHPGLRQYDGECVA